MNKNLPTIKSTSFKSEEIELLRTTYFKDLNDTEISLALKQTEASGLNPFNKEIYAYKVGGRLTLVTGIAGFRKIAHRSGAYLGCKVTIDLNKEEKIFSATAVVKKLVGSQVAEFEATVIFDEYNQKREKWLTMPEAMIRKCAEINALKMAFPNIEQLSDESCIEPVIDVPEHVDILPSPELESQEVPEQEIVVDENDPGEFLVTMGSRKKKPTKIKDIPLKELADFVKWAEDQEVLAPAVSDYAIAANAFLMKHSGAENASIP